MAFEIYFGNEVEAQFIGKIVEVRMVRLVGSADSVDVALLHSDHIRTHSLVGNSSTRVGVVLVSVHAVDDDRLAVDQHVGATHLDTMEANFLADEMLASL